jgi:hypothetical protein
MSGYASEEGCSLRPGEFGSKVGGRGDCGDGSPASNGRGVARRGSPAPDGPPDRPGRPTAAVAALPGPAAVRGLIEPQQPIFEGPLNTSDAWLNDEAAPSLSWIVV